VPSLAHQLLVPYARHVMRAKPIVDPEGERRRFASKRRPLKVPADFTWAAKGGVPVLTHGSGDRTLFYVHGGSYNGNAAAQHFSLVRRLAARCNLRVIFPDYPLAPDFPWTSSHPQMSALLSGLAAEGPVVLAGDSAGGGYALSLAMSLATSLDGPDSHPLESMVLISPWLDVSCSTPGIEEAAEWDPWLRLDRARVYGQWWAGDPTHTSRWEVSPLHGSLTNLPRTLAFQGTRDILCPENRLMRDQAASAGWDYTYVEEPGLMHVYPLLPIPEAKRAFEQMVEFIGSPAV